jgi:hypothetical protein
MISPCSLFDQARPWSIPDRTSTVDRIPENGRDTHSDHQPRAPIVKSNATILLSALLIGDIAFILLHVVLTITNQIANYPLCSLAKDGGYAEYFQYVKEFTIMVLLLVIYAKTKAVGFIAWAGLFLYLLCDDALQFHETLGKLVATNMDFGRHLGIRAEDFGELAVSVVVGSALLAMIGLFYLRGSVPFRRASRHITLLLVGLASLGVLLDTLHFIYEVNWKFSMVMVSLEDGGEMIIMSFIVWYVLLLCDRAGDTGFSVRRLIAGTRLGKFLPASPS